VGCGSGDELHCVHSQLVIMMMVDQLNLPPSTAVDMGARTREDETQEGKTFLLQQHISCTSVKLPTGLRFQDNRIPNPRDQARCTARLLQDRLLVCVP
jgi:hypothetical protein